MNGIKNKINEYDRKLDSRFIRMLRIQIMMCVIIILIILILYTLSKINNIILLINLKIKIF
jgi:uncharacterized membrane protein